MSRTIEEAAEHFRADALRNTPEGKAFSLDYGVRLKQPPGPCIFCKEGRTKCVPVDVDTRIELRIGRFRICQCEMCGEFSVCEPAHKQPQAEEEVKSQTTKAEYDALMLKWQKENEGGPDAAMQKLHRKWAKEAA
jgi:hypothetical protein